MNGIPGSVNDEGGDGDEGREAAQPRPHYHPNLAATNYC